MPRQGCLGTKRSATAAWALAPFTGLRSSNTRLTKDANSPHNPHIHRVVGADRPGIVGQSVSSPGHRVKDRALYHRTDPLRPMRSDARKPL